MSGGYQEWGDICNGNDQGTVTANSAGTALPTLNTWVQLVASTPFDTSYIGVQIAYDFSINWIANVDIGIGGAGSEIVLIPSLVCYLNNSYGYNLSIPAGTRIAARAIYDNSSGTTVIVQLFDGSYMSDGAAGVDAVGFVSGNHSGTAITPSASANTKGSFTQLVASTARDYLGFYVDINSGDTSPSGPAGVSTLTDVAIGAGGSEIVIVPNISYRRERALPTIFYPMAIPAGTRISARCQTSSASGGALDVMIHGVYK